MQKKIYQLPSKIFILSKTQTFQVIYLFKSKIFKSLSSYLNTVFRDKFVEA
jgi:hypothetical protein